MRSRSTEPPDPDIDSSKADICRPSHEHSTSPQLQTGRNTSRLHLPRHTRVAILLSQQIRILSGRAATTAAHGPLLLADDSIGAQRRQPSRSILCFCL